MRPSRLASVLVATAALSACGPTVSIQRARDARIPESARWAWGAEDRDGLTAAEGSRLPADSVADLIRAAVEAELAAKGYARTQPESAQFVMHFHVGQRFVVDTVAPRDDPRTAGAVRSSGGWGGYGDPEDIAERTVTWQEGMLIVDAIEPMRNIVAWRGTIAGEIPARAETRPGPGIRAAVKRLLRDFP